MSWEEKPARDIISIDSLKFSGYLSHVRYIPIQSYDNYIEANIIRSRLEQEEIICWLQDENTATTLPFLSNSIGGIKLMVAEPQVARAVELLTIFKQKAPE